MGKTVRQGPGIVTSPDDRYRAASTYLRVLENIIQNRSVDVSIAFIPCIELLSVSRSFNSIFNSSGLKSTYEDVHE